jgi:integrase
VSWLEHSAKPTLRDNTYIRYENVIRCSIVPHIGRVPLAGLTPQHVQVLQNRLLAAGQAPRSVLKVRLVLGSALDQAEKWSYIPRNPVPLVDPPRVPADEREAIPPDHAYALLDAVQGDRLEALYTVALGLRRGEALGLKWQDVDLDAGVLHVRRALQRVKGAGLRFLELKTRKSRP